MEGRKIGGSSLKRNFISRLLTLIPLGITWLFLDFVFRQPSTMGKPLLRALIPTSFTFPIAAALLALSFVRFAGWYIGSIASGGTKAFPIASQLDFRSDPGL